MHIEVGEFGTKLQVILLIESNSSYEDEILLPHNGWHQLDSLLSSSQHPSLQIVYIAISFSASCSDSIGFAFNPTTDFHTGF
jgi:hypothetical protein